MLASVVKEENRRIQWGGGTYLNVRRGKEERLLLSSGERCLIYSDSRIERSKLFLALCSILKSPLLQGCFICKAWERMFEWEGLPIGSPERGDRPKCSGILKERLR